MKRFYNLVSTSKVGDGYHIMLDNRPVKTKSGTYLCAPNEGIAAQIAGEWVGQVKEIIPETMPFTQILTTKIDRVKVEREVMSAAILKYLDTDLLCYVAEQPEGLVKLQQEKWQIWLDWFEIEFGYKLNKTTGLSAITHDKHAHKAVAEYVEVLDDARFTILQIVTSVSGSLVLGVAMVQGAANPKQIFEACFVEEIFKDSLYDVEKYGCDPAIEKAQKSAMQDLTSAQGYLSLL